MLKVKMQSTTAILLGALLLTLCCSKDKGKKGTEPTDTEVSMTGSLTFPADTLVNFEDVLVGFGDNETTPDTNGAFDIKGNGGVPGLAIVYDQDTIPMLMSIIPDPQKGTQIALDAHSTGLALAFLTPFVCVSDPDGAEEVLSILEGLPEMEELESLLVEKLRADPKALSTEDDEINSALTKVVISYINSYPSLVSRFYPSSTLHLGKRAGSTQSDVYIEPSYEKSGHKVTYVGGDKFKITNSLGRWAYCVTPTEQFYVFPNGNLLDWLRGTPFPPSQREFNLEIKSFEDPKEVNVYGFGWASVSDNVWDSLSAQDQTYAIYGGLSTVLLEFVPHVLSLITNAHKTAGRTDIALIQDPINKTIAKILKDTRIIDRVREYIKAGNAAGLAWFLTKQVISKVAMDGAFRAEYLKAIGLTLSNKALAKLVCWLNVPAKVVMTVNSLTSVAKTILGWLNSRFKTTFKIWKETTEFGNISGSVHDKQSGLPIEGVTVDLEGDEGNPMNPPHQYVTSSDGGFYFGNILVGEKTLKASKEGYKTSSVKVTVLKDTTVTANITLDKESSSVSGKIIDEILLKHSVSDPTFKKEANLNIIDIGGDSLFGSYWVWDGKLNFNLPPGSYWLVAWHDDYETDSIQVVIQADATVQLPRDLLMKPKGTMEGDVYLDMDNNGQYEKHFAFEASSVGAGMMPADGDRCDNPRPFMPVAGMSQTGTYFDGIEMEIDSALVQGPGDYALGSIFGVSCSDYNVKAGVAYSTSREKCYDPEYGYSSGMVFVIGRDSGDAPCNCGITDYGSVVFEEFGTELTDVLAGKIFCYGLAGWKTCHCSCCEDLDGDGEEDDWVVDCAKAYLTIEFRVLVGSLYQIEGSSSYRGMFQKIMMEQLNKAKNKSNR